jgi:hypothetical protein
MTRERIAISIFEDVLFVGGAVALGRGLWIVSPSLCFIGMGILAMACGLGIGRTIRGAGKRGG